jgi:beta-phosphoglucomutase
MLKAVIFDFDGVVADSEHLHYKALNEALKTQGVDVPKDVHWAKYLGYSDYDNIEAVNRDYGMGLSPDEMQGLVRYKTEVFDKLAASETAIIDGVLEFVRMLKDNGVVVAVCSGATQNDIRLMLQGTALAGAFETIVSADDVTKCKPDPEGYKLVLERLNARRQEPLKSRECVVVEDSHWGLEAAEAAGMHRVAVTNTYLADELSEYAETVVSRLDQLTIEDLKDLCK